MYTQIKSFEDACQALGLNPTSLPDVSMLPAKHQNATLAQCKLVIIAQALNNGWEPDWSNEDEYKYFPWFNMNDTSAPFGFSFSDYGYLYQLSCVGSRLCFVSSEVAEYAGKQFEGLYRDYFVITKE